MLLFWAASLPQSDLAVAGPEMPATFLNQIPSPTPQLHLAVCAHTDATMLYKTWGIETAWYFCFPMTAAAQNQASAQTTWPCVRISLIHCIFYIVFSAYFSIKLQIQWSNSNYISPIFSKFLILWKLKSFLIKWRDVKIIFNSMLKHLITLKMKIILYPNIITIIYMYIHI